MRGIFHRVHPRGPLNRITSPGFHGVAPDAEVGSSRKARRCIIPALHGADPRKHTDRRGSMAEYTLVADKTGEVRMDAAQKEARYAELTAHIEATLADEPDLTAAMASIACVLHNGLPYYFWTGFYRRVGPARLLVGPYQGTLGCLSIDFERGVCGAAATRAETLVVEDVHAFPGHIACDSASASEIVVPVFGARGELIAVLDVDSTLPAAFDAVDQRWLERIVALLREKEARPVVWAG
jgi:L-methionine (R)-S-oxide reductase